MYCSAFLSFSSKFEKRAIQCFARSSTERSASNSSSVKTISMPCGLQSKLRLEHNLLIHHLRIKTKYAWAFTRGMYNILKILAVFVVAATYNLTRYPLKLLFKSHRTINAFGAVSFIHFCQLLQGILSYKNLQIKKHYSEEILKLLQSWEETMFQKIKSSQQQANSRHPI